MKKILDKVKENKESKTVTQIKNWYQGRYETVMIQRNFLFVAVLAMIVIFGFTIVGVLKINAEKVYEPFIVQIEENTGIITKVNNQQVREINVEKAVRNSSLVRYVISRESYNFSDYDFNYKQVVRLMSSSEIYQQFNGIISLANPESPLALANEKRIDVKIKSLFDVDEKQNLVQIRITKAQYVNNSPAQPEWEKSYVVSLRYEYVSLELNETDRFINPLGIQIIAYSITEEQSAGEV